MTPKQKQYSIPYAHVMQQLLSAETTNLLQITQFPSWVDYCIVLGLNRKRQLGKLLLW